MVKSDSAALRPMNFDPPSRIAPNEPLDLHVHSPGGDFREGVAIHSLIRIRSGAFHGFVDGRAASAGSLILMPCATITMAPASELMLHFASVEPRGKMQEDDLARRTKGHERHE